MAKTQNLSLNPTKISGVCGRLMCCLSYENEVYADALKKMPKVNSKVKTPDGVGTVVYNNLLKKVSDVKLDGDDAVVKQYALKDLSFEGKVEEEVLEDDVNFVMEIEGKENDESSNKIEHIKNNKNENLKKESQAKNLDNNNNENFKNKKDKKKKKFFKKNVKK